MQYLMIENMKYKRTTVNKLIIFAPLFVVAFAFLAAGISYFQYSSMYWWYSFCVPGIIGLLCMNSKKMDEKSGYHRQIYALPVNLKKVCWNKTIVLLCKFTLMEMVLGALVWVVPIFLFPDFQALSVSQLLIGNGLIVILSAWQIPFCFLLMEKIGSYITIIVNMVLNLGTAVIIGNTVFWRIWPYCWTLKEMEYFLGIKMSGEPLENAVHMQGDFVLVIVLAIGLLIGLIRIHASIFEKREVM